MDGFYKAIGYVFKNEKLAKEALTHSSYANEQVVKSYERLEFLGDSVLSTVISEYLFIKFPKLTEGELTKLRASIVCERSLSEVAISLGIGEFIYFNKGEEASGGRTRISILADIVEAIIAGIFIDSGIEESKKWVLKNLESVLAKAEEGKAFQDYKTELQEYVQGKGIDDLTYVMTGEEGPAHRRLFRYQVKVSDKVLGEGFGTTKKEAEQMAAKAALGQCE
ncbi:MAG: ribonuclease III [Bacillota bacterium]|nr:ribonuclease III [Bacillota bacterium]